MQWQGQIEDLLYEGESVQEQVELDRAEVVVTNRRVLAFTPGGDGENFQQAERPNVTGVTSGMEGNRRYLSKGAQYALVGAILAPIGYFVDFGSIFGDVSFETEGANRFGAGDLLSMAELLITALTWVGRVLLALGVIALVAGVALLVLYQRKRTPVLRLTLAGDGDDITLPYPERMESTEAHEQLQRALFPETGTDSRP